MRKRVADPLLYIRTYLCNTTQGEMWDRKIQILSSKEMSS